MDGAGPMAPAAGIAPDHGDRGRRRQWDSGEGDGRDEGADRLANPRQMPISCVADGAAGCVASGTGEKDRAMTVKGTSQRLGSDYSFWTLQESLAAARTSDATGNDHGFAAFLDAAAAGDAEAGGEEIVSAPEIEVLGGAPGVGRDINTPDDLVHAVEAGFPFAAIDHLSAAGFEKGEIEHLIAPVRTQQRRRHDGRLSPTESDAAWRLARILTRAEGTLGSRARAFVWLRHANKTFGDVTPMSLLKTEAGGRRVEELLLRADFGMLA
jgi:putative toxin-antitoxin system antitoxin component (TIGR02293 family)